jgi:hypothetical protein
MSDEKKEPSPMKNPIAWVFRASVLLLGSVIALNVAIASLRPILPWLIGGIGLAAATWLVVAIIRWRRSRW